MLISNSGIEDFNAQKKEEKNCKSYLGLGMAILMLLRKHVQLVAGRNSPAPVGARTSELSRKLPEPLGPKIWLGFGVPSTSQ